MGHFDARSAYAETKSWASKERALTSSIPAWRCLPSHMPPPWRKRLANRQTWGKLSESGWTDKSNGKSKPNCKCNIWRGEQAVWVSYDWWNFDQENGGAQWLIDQAEEIYKTFAWLPIKRQIVLIPRKWLNRFEDKIKCQLCWCAKYWQLKIDSCCIRCWGESNQFRKESRTIFLQPVQAKHWNR